MQSVSGAFTAEERDSVRNIAQNLQISWKKESTLGNRTFTIGVSTIGGNDVIGINPGAIGSPGNYRYFDESDYVKSLAWEQGLSMPLGGLAKGLAEVELENTTGRFTPRYAGGSSELFTSILPRRPFIINAGFEVDGIEQTIPQFSGILTRQPEVQLRERTAKLVGADYIDFFQNRYLDQEVMSTGFRVDEIYETMLSNLGLSTAQYELDTGINVIPFALFEKGTRYRDIFHQLAESENGHFYQDEEGKFRFENRQHWDGSPHDTVSRIIYTAQVIDSEIPDEDHIINAIEIQTPIREKQPAQTIFNLPSLTGIEISANSSIIKFFEFEDPVLALTDPTNGGANSYFVANTLEDETGTNLSSSITFTNLGTFAKAVKYRITNTSSTTAFVTQLVLSGRIAKQTGDLYYRDIDSSSVTAYEERPLRIENPYIQNLDWARSYAAMIFRDYSEPEKLQMITIRAVPSLQLGDMISWQGRYWRIFNKRLRMSASEGFVQDLVLLQREITTYFRIGISTIGGSDQIAP